MPEAQTEKKQLTCYFLYFPVLWILAFQTSLLVISRVFPLLCFTITHSPYSYVFSYSRVFIPAFQTCPNHLISWAESRDKPHISSGPWVRSIISGREQCRPRNNLKFLLLDEFYLYRWYYLKQGKNWPNAHDPPMISEETTHKNP